MKFATEWLDAPGVKDRVLSATWARLEIRADGHVVSDLVAFDTRRTGIYGPVLPLVEWLAENWWNLLYEPSPTSPLMSGRSAPPWMLNWVRRHNLLSAREGMALPDTTIVRDGDEIVLMWAPDPAPSTNGHVRFVGSGQVRVAASAFSEAASDLIDRTLARIEVVVGECEEAQRLAESWAQIQSSDEAEQFVCRSLALLGADPYDPEDASEGLLTQLSELHDRVPADLFNDLLEGASVGDFCNAADWIAEHGDFIGNGNGIAVPEPIATWASDSSAHGSGYRVARDVRKALGLAPRDPVIDLAGLLVEQMGWDPDRTHRVRAVEAIDGMVGLSRVSRRPVLLSPEVGQRASRFRMARAAFFTSTGRLSGGRLLTRAVTPWQRAGRAFAAEFLAPADALARRVGGRVGEAEVASLADAFNVSPRLIEHQIENHGIGTVCS